MLSFFISHPLVALLIILVICLTINEIVKNICKAIVIFANGNKHDYEVDDDD